MLTCLLAIGSLPLPLPLPFPFPYFYTPHDASLSPLLRPYFLPSQTPTMVITGVIVFDRFSDKEPLIQLCTTRPVPPAVAPPAPPNTTLEQQFPATATPGYIFAPPRETPTAHVPAHIHAHAPNHTHHQPLRPSELSTENGREGGLF
jgi:hypothetical protein